MNVRELRDWLAALPDDMQDAEVDSVVHGQPCQAKRVVAYRWKDGSGKGIVVNSMGTHISDHAWSDMDVVSLLSA